MKQVLVNLIKNAFKFTNMSGGKIKVTTNYDEEKSGTVAIKVKDTGSGIDAQDMAKLFSRFGKLQRTAKMNSEGIGLGLTIVQQIV